MSSWSDFSEMPKPAIIGRSQSNEHDRLVDGRVWLGSTIGFCKERAVVVAQWVMCENSRQRVIHISSAVAVIFLRLQVARAVNGG
jgi:hypothetical protein